MAGGELHRGGGLHSIHYVKKLDDVELTSFDWYVGDMSCHDSDQKLFYIETKFKL